MSPLLSSIVLSRVEYNTADEKQDCEKRVKKIVTLYFMSNLPRKLRPALFFSCLARLFSQGGETADPN